MSQTPRPAPIFDRSFLLELGGGTAFREAEKLFESHAVNSVLWEWPVLTGLVQCNDRIYAPELNLRSTVFAQNKCECCEGRRGKVCVHALAVAMYYQALKHEAAINPINEKPAPLVSTTKTPELHSINLAENGTSIRLIIFLPPNFEVSAGRGAIAVKLDVVVGREVLPMGKLPSEKIYSVLPAELSALLSIESWCGGNLPSIIQLSPDQLHHLLDCLKDEPVIYWLNEPDIPIQWNGDTLPGVHEFLLKNNQGIKEEVVEKSARINEEFIAHKFSTDVNLREKVKPNLRRIAESKGPKLWESRKGDYPVANAVSASMDEYDTNRIVVDGSTNYIAIRLPSARTESVQMLRTILKSEGFMLEPTNRKWWLRDRHKTLNFLAAHWKSLEDEYQALFTENFNTKLAGVAISTLSIEAREESDRFVLDISLSAHSDEVDLSRSLASGKKYLEEVSGGITLLESKSIEQLHEIQRAVSGLADRPFTPTFSKRLDTRDLSEVEDLLEELSAGWQPPEAWYARSRAIKEVSALEPAPVRPDFDNILRTYQRIGVAWLWHLYRNQLGGILADEMGLGKTLQALALVECINDQDIQKKPALVVCPASLVENWLREANRFTPKTSAMKHYGNNRAKEPVILEDYDLVITSYGTLRQDADLLATVDWGVVIADEAQHIKNRRSQNAKTLTSLHADGRFLLTGTPVENSLDDLISLFSFLMPGYLERPAGKLSMADKAWHNKRQTKRAAAYILRRTKKEVAPELPEKIEKTFYCELGEKQHQFYQDTLNKTRRDISKLEMSGAKAGRVQFAAFTELLRLRQACVDPRILDENFPKKESAKLAAFDEVLNECIDAGSRILVFSSFVSALKLLVEHLQARDQKFSYLDGKTKNRLALVDQFNEDTSISVFLISLKAGGTGLNLTGADTVLHFDPWWNPAAEAQATDRAHRIGQTKVVTSIKLIAAGTVEEKVLELQNKKAEILKDLFEESESVNAKVSLEDIKELLS